MIQNWVILCQGSNRCVPNGVSPPSCGRSATDRVCPNVPKHRTSIFCSLAVTDYPETHIRKDMTSCDIISLHCAESVVNMSRHHNKTKELLLTVGRWGSSRQRGVVATRGRGGYAPAMFLPRICYVVRRHRPRCVADQTLSFWKGRRFLLTSVVLDCPSKLICLCLLTHMLFANRLQLLSTSIVSGKKQTNNKTRVVSKQNKGSVHVLVISFLV